MPSSYPFTSPSSLSHLDQSRLSYHSLSRRLFSLPHRLNHPGLIPVAPRLYLSGQVIDTNHITVVLGASGEDAYYAERSAFQARGIVQRRLADIDHRITNLSLVNSPVQSPNNSNTNTTQTQPRTTTECPTSDSFNPPTPALEVNQPPRSTQVSSPGPRRPQEPTSAKKPTTRAPILTDAPQSTTAGSGSSVENRSPKRDPARMSRGKEIDQETKYGKEVMDAQAVPGMQVNVDNGSVQKLQKKVSFSEPIVTQVGVAASFKTRKRPHRKSPLALALAQARAEHEELLRSGKLIEGGESEEEDSEAADGASGQELEGEKMKGEWNKVVENAERQMREGGVVNLVEVYEGDENEPSRVEMGQGFVPDESVVWDDECEEYLDLTGGHAGSVKRATSTNVIGSAVSVESSVTDESNSTTEMIGDEKLDREDFIMELLEMEREEKEKEEREEERREQVAAEKAQQEENEFGKGFSRGFFNRGGSGGTKKTKKVAATSSKEISDGDGTTIEASWGGSGNGMDSQSGLGEDKRNEKEWKAGRVETREVVHERVMERVVERRGSRSGSGHGRKNRQVRAANLKQMIEGTGTDGWSEAESSTIDDGENEESAGVVSRFRQMRQRQRLGSKGQMGRTGHQV